MDDDVAAASLEWTKEPPLAPLTISYWLEPGTWPDDTPGQPFLLRAAVEAGPILLGQDWTGEEIGTQLLGEISKEDKQTILHLLSKYEPEYKAGGVYTDGHWHSARAIAAKLDDAARPIVGRLRKVTSALVAEFRDGRILTYSRNREGRPERPKHFPDELWWSGQWPNFFKFGTFVDRSSHFHETRDIFIDGEQLRAFLRRPADRGEAVPSARLGADNRVASQPLRPAAARPPAVNLWAALPETERLVREMLDRHRWPSNHDNLATSMVLVWLEAGWGEPPTMRYCRLQVNSWGKKANQ
jgi:hypothetical protein